MFDIDNIKNNQKALQNQIAGVKNNYISDLPIDEYIYHRLITKVDPIEYCHRVLRGHLTENRRYLHENQIALIKAVCNPHKLCGIM